MEPFDSVPQANEETQGNDMKNANPQQTHTPEPWDHHKLGNDADQWEIHDNTGRTIGLSYHGEANARLMAAAPDMLAELQRLAESFNWPANHPACRIISSATKGN